MNEVIMISIMFGVFLLLVVMPISYSLLQIDCQSNNDSTACQQFTLTYLQSYTGNIQNVPAGCPPQGYNQQQMPVLSNHNEDDQYIQNGGGLKVYMSLELVDMVNIDTSDGLVYLNLNIDLWWTDYRLAWNQSLNGVGSVNFYSSYMWIPDITLYNQADGSNILDAPVILSSNGDCWLSRQAYIVYDCNMYLDKFPFDTQQCAMQWGSWTYPIGGLELLVTPNQFSKNSTVNELYSSSFEQSISWNTVSFTPSQKVISTNYGSYAFVYYTLTCQRYSNYYIYTAIMPDIIVTVITVIGLWIPDINSRTGISVTSLLTVIAVLWTITANLPISRTSTWMNQFSTFCICIIGVCCVENTLVAYAQTKTGTPPKWMKHFINANNCCDVFCLLYGYFYPVPKRRKKRNRHRTNIAVDIEMNSISNEKISENGIHDESNDTTADIDNDVLNPISEADTIQTNQDYQVQEQLSHELEKTAEEDSNKLNDESEPLIAIDEEELSWNRVGRSIDRISRVAIPIAFSIGALKLLADSRS